MKSVTRFTTCPTCGRNMQRTSPFDRCSRCRTQDRAKAAEARVEARRRERFELLPEAVRQRIERVQTERERIKPEWLGRRFIVEFADYDTDPNPMYSVVECKPAESSKFNVRTRLRTGLTEDQARASAEEFEQQYPDGLPAGYLWERLPEANKREISRILAQGAHRLVDEYAELLDGERKGCLSSDQATRLQSLRLRLVPKP